VSSTDEHTFFTHRLVSTFDRVPFQLTDALFSLNRLPLLDEVQYDGQLQQ
jgi:hypothetical protein